VYRELDEHPTDEQFPGVVVLRLDGGLFFATSDALEDRVREVELSTPNIRAMVLDCEGIDFIDSQGSAKMGEVLELVNQAGVALRLARVKPAVEEVLKRDGILDRLGADRTHGTVHRAVQSHLEQAGNTPPEE
jgi:SulP family sulfate permease